MTRGRPPSTRQQPSLATPFDKLRDPDFLDRLRSNMADKLTSSDQAIKNAVKTFETDSERTRRRTGIDYKMEQSDVLRSMVYEQSFPASAVLGQVRDQGHVSNRVLGDFKTSDCPLNYLHQRVEKKNRISDIQYAAGIRYREDALALARVGSNTAATIAHIMLAPELTPEDRRLKLEGVQLMKGGDDSHAIIDPTTTILASVYRVRRIEDRMETWELEVLRNLVVAERTIGMIATLWGQAPEAVSVLARLALWKLARIMESTDREFQAWLTVERQINGEGRQ